MRALLSFLLFSYCAAASAQTPAPANDKLTVRERERRVYVPFDELEKVFKDGGKGVFLPYREFLDLWNELTLKREEDDKPPPAEAVLAKAEYTGRVEGDSVILDAKITVESFKKGWVLLPLTEKAAPGIGEATTGKAVLRSRADGSDLMLPEKGVYEIALKIYAPIIRSAGKSQVTLNLPRAAVSRLSITVPGEGLEFELNPAAAFTAKVEGGQTQFACFFGAGAQQNIAWGAAQVVTQMSPLVLAQHKLTTQIGIGSVTTTADIALRVLRAPINELKIGLPADQEILGVTGAGIKEWKIETVAGKASRKTLIVLPEKPLRDDYALKLQLEGPVAKLPAEVSVPDLEVIGAAQANGEVVVGAEAQLDVTPKTLTSTTRSLAGDSRSQVGTFRILRQPYQLTLNVAEAKPQVEATSLTKLSVRREAATLSTEFSYTVRRVGIFETRLTPPAGWTITDVKGQIESWNLEGTDVVIKLPKQTAGEFQFTLTARQTRAQATADIVLPVFTLQNVTRHEALLGATIHSSLEPNTKDIGDFQQEDGRLFTQSLGNHSSVRLQRSARGLERGEGPVPSATVRSTLTLRELEPETVDAEIEYEFPGAVRRTLEFAVDAPANGAVLEIGTLNMYTTLPGAGTVRIPTMSSQTRREGGKLICTITMRHEASHRVLLKIEGAQRYLNTSGTRAFPLIQPTALRVKQDLALLHDDSMKVKVNGGTAQRSTNTNRNGLQDAGRWQWTGTTAPTYDVQPAALFAEADVSYVFQLSEQKAELLAALTLKRKRGLWTRAVVGLPAGYEVQAVQGPALTAWQHEGTQLYLQLDSKLAGPEARVVVHLAKVAAQPVTSWKLEPLKLENYEKVGGKALIVAHAASDIKLPDPTQLKDLKELDPTALDSVFAIAPPMEKKRALQHEGTAWTVDVTLTRQASRFSAETIALVLASDAGIRISQQVVALVEQGAVRQLSVRLPAALPEAVVSGPLLRETRSHIDGTERVYECSLQTEVLDRAELTFDLDLPLTAELDVPFVKVVDASRLARWFVLDNASAREAKNTTQTALEEVAREAVPYLPANLSRPKFFRATGDGTLKLAYQQLTSTEGTAALITLADLTTVLRPDGTRWDIAQYSLINRSLQFLPMILPDQAELISVSVSGEPVRADEESQGGRRVRLIPLIHTRPGQRALEVKMIYRFPQSGGLQKTAKLDDPEIVGLTVERTTWTVWTPQGWNLKDFDGNMTATAAEGRELLQLEGMLSELGEANRALSSGKLDYGDAEAAYREANALAQMVQQKKRELLNKSGSGTLTLSSSIQPSEMDTELKQQQELLKGNWDSNYAKKKTATKGGKIEKGQTAWGFNKAAPEEQQLRLAGNNTFTGSVTTNGGQLFNDNVAVDNSYFANGQLLPQQPVPLTINGGAVLTLSGANTYSGGTTVNEGTLQTSTANVASLNFTNGGAQAVTQNISGSFNTVNSNARSNNLGQNVAPALPAHGTILRSGGMQVAADAPANSVLFNSKDMQALPGGGAGVAIHNSPLIRADEVASVITNGAMNDSSGASFANSATTLYGGNLNMGASVAGARSVGTSVLTSTVVQSASSTLPLGSEMHGAIRASAPPQGLKMPLTAPAAPAMGADPFGAPAPAAAPVAADPFAASAGLTTTAAIFPIKEATPVDNEGKEQRRMLDARPVTLAQTVESLRPTGRRALGIELPLDGTAHHFSKLKDHAVLEVAIQRVGDPKTTSRLLYLSGGLLLWLAIGWKLKRRSQVV